MIKPISNFLIDNPIVKWVILFLFFLFFLFSIQEIKRYAFPRVDLNQMIITSFVQGFSAFEMEVKVTDKIEDKLKNISGIESYTSKTYQNLSDIFIQIDPDTDVKEVKDEIRNAVDSVNDFPQEMNRRPVISEIKIDNKPMMILGVISLSDHEKKARQHAVEIKKRLQESDSISKVQEDIPLRKIKILLSKDKMVQLGITFEEVIDKLNKNQKHLSAGNIEDGYQTKLLTTYFKAKSLEDIENLIIRTVGTEDRGVLIRVKDIAQVEDGLEKKDKKIKFNGFSGYQLSLIRNKESDIIQTTKEVKEILTRYVEEVDDPDLKLIVHEDDSKETEERLTIAYENGFFGLLLVCLTLFFFLNRSIAFWSCLSIPKTFMVSITLMWLSGVSINTVSLCGIIIMMGIVVDNPTIIGESIYHYRQMNFSNHQSTLSTLDRMVKPLIFAGLTTVVSFASMFFIPGTLGSFAIEIPMIVIFMLVSSFFESIFILPAHLAHSRMSASKPWGEKIILFLRSKFELTLDWGLKRNYRMIGLLVLFLVSGVFFSIYFIKFQLFPIDQAFKINFTGTTDINKNIAFTEAQTKKIEEIFIDFPEKNIVSSFRTRIGGTANNEFEIQLRLISYFDRKTTAEEFKNYVLEQVKNHPDLEIKSFDYYVDGGGVPSGRPIEINVFSYSLEKRKKVVEMISQDLKEMGYFSQIIHNIKEGKEEYKIIPKEKMYYSGVDLKRIAEVLRSAFEGVPVGNFEYEEETIDWLLQFDDSSKNFDNPLEKIYVVNNRNQNVLVNLLVSMEKRSSLTEIQHEGGNRKNVLSANFDKNLISGNEVYRQLTEKYKDLEKQFPDVKITFSGEAKKSSETFTDFILAIVGSVVIIYLLLVVQFNSFIQPFMVITSIPFGIIGIVFVFSLHGYSLSFLGMIGVLGFGGVVINASLIMVDYINEIKKGNIEEEKIGEMEYSSQKEYLRKAIVRGSVLRFRPIFITTFTTTIGLVPTAYGVLGRTDVVIAPMTLTMLWGLLIGTLFGLYAVPMFYLFGQDLTTFFKRVMNRKSNKD